jgi:hypothetical protein
MEERPTDLELPDDGSNTVRGVVLGIVIMLLGIGLLWAFVLR